MQKADPPRTQAETLRSARQSMRMSQAHLAQAAGVSDRTVRRAEAGRPVTVEVLRALCSVLGLDARSLSMPAPLEAVEAWRPITDYELRMRYFFHEMSKPVGGVHPILFLLLIGLLIHFRPVTLIYFAFALAVMWMFSRRNGATRGQSRAFLRGHAFSDGTPIRLRERVEFEIARAGASDSPAR